MFCWRNRRQGRWDCDLIVLAEERMLKGSFHRDPLWWLKLHHLGQQVDRFWMAYELMTQFRELLISVDFPLWKTHFHFWKLIRSLPIGLFWCTQDLKDLKELSYLTFSVEQRLAMRHFIEDATHWPNVDCCTINFFSKKNLRCSVPQCNYFMSIWFERQTKWSCQPEVRDLNCLLIITDKNITWLDISVHNSSLMAVKERL